MSDQKSAAAYHGSGPCPRGCCWTPYGSCARGWTCEHHKAAAAEEWDKARATALSQELEAAASLRGRGTRSQTSEARARRAKRARAAQDRRRNGGAQ